MIRLVLPLTLAAVSGVVYAATPGLSAGLYEVTSKGAGEDSVSVSRHCVTPADAARGGVDLSDLPGRCALTSKTIAGGKIDLASNCVDDRGAKSSAKITGTYTADGYALTTRMISANPAMPFDMTIKSKGRKIAATCSADDND